MRVFKNKFGSWDTLFKNKMLNGEEMKYYMPVQFQKGQEPLTDSIDIEPVKWWGSCFMTRDGNVRPKLFIAEWTADETETARNDDPIFDIINDVPKDEKKDDNLINIEAEELPFY